MTVPTVDVVPRFAIEAPAIPAPTGGLLDAVTVVNDTSGRLAMGGVDYVTGPCGPASLAPGLCLPNGDIPVDGEKEIESPEIVEGDPFATYRRIGCTIPGEPYGPMAQLSFERGEPYAVEKGFYYSVLQHATVIDGGDTPQSAAAVVGALEQILAENYAGVGVLLTSRQGAIVLGAQQVAFPGMTGVLTDILGTSIAALSFGTAGPDGAAAPAGSFWVYIAGGVTLYKGQAFTSEPVRDTNTNESTVLIERVWSATVECEVYAALVSACPCTGCDEGSLPDLPDLAPVITAPADGATVPKIHDVTGTARAGTNVQLWYSTQNEDGSWTEYRYTQDSLVAQPDGTFAFTGDHEAASGKLRWRVRTSAGVWSDPVEITVEDA